MAGSSGQEFPTLEEVQASVKMMMMRKESGRQTSNIINQQQQHDNNNNRSLSIDIRAEDHNAAAAAAAATGSTLAARFKSVMAPQDSKSSGRSSSCSSKWPRIHKVPRMLRGINDFKMLFEPRVVSLGPYHHHKPELRPAEALKRQMTRQFVLENGQGIEVLYQKIASEISDLRKCYKKSALRRYNNEDLAWMMLVDGCSMLHYISHCRTMDKMKELPAIDPQNTAFAKQDLFLLENQLPFRVLELLFESTNTMGTAEWMKSIEQFICGMFKVDYHAYCMINTADDQKKKEKPSHLLDLLRRVLVGDPRKIGSQAEGAVSSGWNTFRKVDELKASGIAFRSNESAFLTDVSFHSYTFFGFLRLPEIIVDDSAKSRLLNLIAYEMCSDVSTNLEVTSYVCFIDSLIDDAEDVKELRRKHIVRNLLGSDQQVADLFNEIATDLVPNVDVYADVKTRIQKHYENRVNRWVTEGLHEHFSNPWTGLAFLAALLALLMGAVQTWYTIFPAHN